MTQHVNPEVFARRLIELYGGREAALEAMERRHRAIAEVWNRDAVTIGRILRSHLFVEHFLTEYLQFQNPKLGDLEEARLSFTQKVSLINDLDKSVAYLVPGLQRLNRVRNRLAHTLQSEVMLEDRDLFLSIEIFQAMRKALAAPENPSDHPIAVLEEFAKYAGLTLAPNPDHEKWTKAIWGDSISANEKSAL